MRITARLIIHCILPMDGIDGEGRIKRMSPKGINRKPSKSFNQDFSDGFLLSLSEGYQHHCTLNSIHKDRWKVYLYLFNDSMLDA